MDSCYVYIYLDPRKFGKYYYSGLNMCFLYEPIYIGKGSSNRLKIHLKESYINKDKNLLKGRKLKKILNKFKSPYILKITEKLSDKEAYLYEKYVIELIGKIIDNRGPLTNIADGGVGFNCNSTPWNKNKKMSKEYKKSLSIKLSSQKNRKVNSLSKMGDRNPMYRHISKETVKLFIELYNKNCTKSYIRKHLNIGRKIFKRLELENRKNLSNKVELKKNEISRIKTLESDYIKTFGCKYGVITYIGKKEDRSRQYITKLFKSIKCQMKPVYNFKSVE